MGPMPRISVVVPIHNVEAYLRPCLRSIATQTSADLEVVMVDDGSTDGSAAIAADFARRDTRFRLLAQPNAGLGAARNTGADAARGEFLAFVDGDDVLTPRAYERLLAALDRTGSDFATGNVHRLAGTGTSQAAFLARTFARTRLATHVTRFRPLLADRVAWNKLWRRSFWDAERLRFPEGVVHEDIPVTLPAHFSARSVDVIAEPVYLWRVREDGAPSITQRRLERRVLLDRLAAIEHVSAHLAVHGPRGAKAWYDERLVADDLRLHLDLLGDADEGYRELFLDRVNAFLDGAHDGIYAPLAAIDRLKWHLVRRRLLPELLEVLRFQRHELPHTPPQRRLGRWYGDYPFRGDRRLAIPGSVYRLGREDAQLALSAGVESVHRDGKRIVVRGRAAIEGLGGRQRIAIAAFRPGRRRIGPVRLATIAADGAFEAALDPAALRGDRYELRAQVRARGMSRRRSRFAVEAPRERCAVDVPAGDTLVSVAAAECGKVTVDVRTRWMTVLDRRFVGEYLELTGELRMGPGARPTLEARRESDGLAYTYPVRVDDGRTPGTFGVRLLLEELRPDDDAAVWELWAVDGALRVPLSLAEGVPLYRSRDGGAAVRLTPQATRAAAPSDALAGSQLERT
jgi:CDP-glycerol glycerophosphotransferase